MFEFQMTLSAAVMDFNLKVCHDFKIQSFWTSPENFMRFG